MDLNNLIIPIFLLIFIRVFPFNVKGFNCSIANCGNLPNSPNIRFPFRVKTVRSTEYISDPGKELNSCGYPGFDVWCDGASKDTLIELPSSGNFSVKNIDYSAQEMWINDPNNCLPKRLLNFDLSNSPFIGVYHQDFSFFNCSKTLNITTQNSTNSKGFIGPIKCLSGTHHFVYATLTNGTISNHTTTLLAPLNCSLVAPLVKVPVQWPLSLHGDTVESSTELHDDLRLSWYMPECRPCEMKGQMCGIKTNSSGSQVIICSDFLNQGNKVGKLPLTTFIAVILVICFPSIICVVGSLIIWIRACYRHRRTILNRQIQSTNQVPHINELGLEEVNIEFARQVVRLGLEDEASPDYQPTIVISEIQELIQGPNRENENNTCAICMGEYRRKDRIGTLPQCGHFFHANCINKWLLSRGRFGKTCPICRAPVDSL